MRLSTLRKVIYWLFIALYFITAPILTLYALGFVFDPVSKNLVKTGIISVITEPKSLDILIDGHRRGKSPAAISGLRPGRYKVEISRKNYQPWSRELEVRQEEVTRIEHILLIPKELHPSKSADIPVEAFLPSDDGKYLFLVNRAQEKVTILTHDVKKKKSFPVVEFEEKDSKVNSVEISFSADDKRVLIGFLSGSRTEYAVSVVSEDALPVFLSKFIQDPISNARFHPYDSEKLFCLNGNRIDLIDLGNHSKKAGLVDQVFSFEVIGDKIYGFDSNRDLFSADLEGKRVVNLFPNQGFKKFLFGGEDFEPNQVFMTEKGTMIWLSEDGKLLMNRLPYFIDEDIKSVRLMPGLEQLLFWKSKELWLLDLQTAGKRDTFFEEGPQKRLLWKSDRPILFAQIIRQGKYAVMATSKTIELIEMNLANSNLVSSQTIAEHWAGDEPSIHLDEPSGKMYWTGCDPDERAQICEAELLEPSLFSFSIKFTKPYHPPVQISTD